MTGGLPSRRKCLGSRWLRPPVVASRWQRWGVGQGAKQRHIRGSDVALPKSRVRFRIPPWAPARVGTKVYRWRASKRASESS